MYNLFKNLTVSGTACMIVLIYYCSGTCVFSAFGYMFFGTNIDLNENTTWMAGDEYNYGKTATNWGWVERLLDFIDTTASDIFELVCNHFFCLCRTRSL